MAATSPVMSQCVGQLVLDALGFTGRRITKLSLHFEVDQPVVVRIESLAEGEGVAGLARMLRDFELVKRDGVAADLSAEG